MTNPIPGPTSASAREQGNEERGGRLRRRAAALLLAQLLVATAVGCGIPTGDSSFEELDGDALGGLNLPTSTTTTTTTTTVVPVSSPDLAPELTAPPETDPPPPMETVAVYFINRGSLSPVTFEVDPLAGLNELIQLLEDGPVNDNTGLRRESFVEEGLIIGTPSTDGGVIQVELDRNAFARISRSNQRQAIAQIVVTLLSNTPAVGQVSFTIDGDVLLVPADGGSREAASVDDFDSLLGSTRSTVATVVTVPTTTVPTTTVPPGPEPTVAQTVVDQAPSTDPPTTDPPTTVPPTTGT